MRGECEGLSPSISANCVALMAARARLEVRARLGGSEYCGIDLTDSGRKRFQIDSRDYVRRNLTNGGGRLL